MRARRALPRRYPRDCVLSIVTGWEWSPLVRQVSCCPDGRDQDNRGRPCRSRVRVASRITSGPFGSRALRLDRDVHPDLPHAAGTGERDWPPRRRVRRDLVCFAATNATFAAISGCEGNKITAMRGAAGTRGGARAVRGAARQGCAARRFSELRREATRRTAAPDG